MSAEEAKPLEAPAGPLTLAPETSPAVAEPTPAVEAPKVEETKPAEETPAATTAAETTEAAKEEVKPVEPKESGHLHYNAPSNFLKEYLPLPPKKVFFWFGEEPVEPSNLKAYLAKGKEAASSTAAWASQTGKGLLFFNKHGEDKAAPSGALNLADAEDIKENGINEFIFKLHGHKHKFVAENTADRDSWLSAVKKVAEEAKAKKEEITSSESYKESLAKLKPAPVAAVTAPKISEETPKKSVEETPAEDESKKTAKSRSRSRGPLAGLFKSKKEEKAEEPKAEEKKEEAAPATTAPAAAAEPSTTEPAAETVAGPVITDAVPPVEEKKDEAQTPKEAKKDRRQSRFESFFGAKKDKKEPKKEEISEVAPKIEEPKTEEAAPAEAAIAADPVAAAAPVEEAPKTEEVTKEETTPTKPATERKSSLQILKGFAQKVRSPSSEHPPPVAEASKTEPAAETTEAPAVPDAAVLPLTEETAATNGETKTDKAEKRRSSFFNIASFNKKKETPAAAEEATIKAEEPEVAAPIEPVAAEDTPKKSVEEKPEVPAKDKDPKESPIASLGRRFSKAIRGDKAKKEAKSATAVEETKEEAKPTEPVAEESKVEEPVKEESATTSSPNAIGDVVPEAVTVGAPPASTPVSAAA